MAKLLCLGIMYFSILIQQTISEVPLLRPTGDHLEAVHRFRRRINQYEGDSQGPLSYLKQLRNNMMDQGNLELAGTPTSIWCLMDQDILDDSYHPKPANRRCSMVQRFSFSIEEFALQLDSFDNVNLLKSVLRVYLQPINRLLPNEAVDIQVNISARALTNESDYGEEKFVSSQIISVSKDTVDHWVELDIANGICSRLWDNIDNLSRVELIVHFRKLKCVAGQKKIPIQILDPATIPIDDTNRRSKHWPLQPFVLIYLEDENKRKQLQASVEEVQQEQLLLDEFDYDTEEENMSVQKRATVEHCTLKPLYIYFADLGMHHILVPAGYNANQCSGDCSRRTRSKNNVNNHSTLVATAREWFDNIQDTSNTTTTPIPLNPRCVSLSYNPFMLVILQRNLNMVSHMYSDMVSTVCGCRA